MIKSKFKLGLSDLFSSLPVIEKSLHFAILFSVICQLISSGFMHVHGDTVLANISGVALLHIYGGLLLIPLALTFTVKVLSRRKCCDLYPWAYGRFDVIKQDIQSLIKLKMPLAKPSGLAACIEGLGIFALLLALVTGGGWYWFLTTQGPSQLLLSIHKLSVTFIQVYFFGHASAALLHLFVWWRK